MKVNPGTALGKTTLRAGYQLARLYWFLVRPETEGAKAVLTRKGEILLVSHTYAPGWSFPGGGLKKGESAGEAVRRELREELGVTPDELIYLGIVYTTREYKKDTIHVFRGELAAGECAPDDFEIAALDWYEPSHLPKLHPMARDIYDFYTQHTRS